MRVAGIAFSGRWAALSYVAATFAVQRLPELPSLRVVAVVLLVGVLAFFAAIRLSDQAWRHRVLVCLIPMLFALAAFAIGVYAAVTRLADQLPAEDENRVSKLVFEIVELPRLRPDSRQFVAKVLESRPTGVPQRILVNWNAPGWAGPYATPKKHRFPELHPGQIWQANVIVKTPHGSLNPHGFDYESYLFAQGIRAIANIRGSPRLVEVKPVTKRSLGVQAESLRHAIRERMLPFLEAKRYGGVITALSIGDQASIPAGDWEIFNRSGLTHLVSISGAHVTLIASLVAALAAWVWRRLRIGKINCAEWVPAQTVASYIAVVIAGMYCVIAGWGVPAQRTFLMLAIIVLAYAWRLSLQASQILAVAAVAVLVLDPWAILSSGFWLSFGAVAVLFACGIWQGESQQRRRGLNRWWDNLKTASVWQLFITVALFPPLALLFNEISLISPLSNAYAIPLISLLVTPLSLLFAATSLFAVLDPVSAWVAWLSHGLIELLMVPTIWLCALPIASIPVAAAPAWSFVLALIGVVGALSPRTLPAKELLWLLILPFLFWGRERLAEGEWRLTALDVGQGSAVVIQTAHSVLLFDTGVRRSRESDVGSQTIHPYLRTAGLHSIDVAVVSHADLDHVGGVASVLQRYQVKQAYSSFNLTDYVRREERLLGLVANTIPLPESHEWCQAGTTWQVDGVEFRFLWPESSVNKNPTSSAERNTNSCVLSVRGPWHAALLMGDVGTDQELRMVKQGLSAHDVVMVGHHGSNTSSAAAFVAAVNAQVAIAQVGWWSRFGHPHRAVERRWQRQGSHFFRSDYDGAVSVWSRSAGLNWQTERSASKRYWHNVNARLHRTPT